MRKILIISLASLISIGCGGAAQQTPTVTTINSNQTTNNAPVVQTSNVSTAQPEGNQAVVSSHSNTAEKPATAPPSESLTSTGSPMARPVDVNSLTADIEKAEKEYKKNPATKDRLAKAYFIRATALTEAAQYPAALGDYRKGLKLEPNDEAAKSMHDEIVRIFKTLKREPPKEGEEPKPLAIK